MHLWQAKRSVNYPSLDLDEDEETDSESHTMDFRIINASVEGDISVLREVLLEQTAYRNLDLIYRHVILHAAHYSFQKSK